MKKRRKLLVMIITLVLICVSLTGCSGGVDHESSDINEENEGNVGNEEKEPIVKGLVVIDVVKIDPGAGYRDLYQFIMYDPETYEMFSYVEWADGGGIIAMHNPDGTPRLYDPSK